MERKKVQSSNILSIGYSKDKSTMEVEFNTHAVYQYSPIDFATYREIMDSESIGKAFHRLIRNNPKISTQKIK